MFAIRNPVLALFASLAVLASAASFAKESPPAAPMKLKFSGVDYVHRWSRNGQNEFTPTAQPDLKTWRDMVTVVVHEKVGNGDQLAALANGVLGNYQKAGQILRTDSRPRTATAEAQHFIAAMLGAPGVTEAVFARVMLHEGKGVVLVYSHRAYGDKSADAIGAWVTKNGQATEQSLMAWAGAPKLAQLRALPQAR